jgi:hypothetical protein
MKHLIGLWIEGVRVFGRFLWFVVILGLLMIPFGFLDDLIHPTQDAVFVNGHFDPRAGVVFALLLLYLPFACVLAARITRQLRKSS